MTPGGMSDARATRTKSKAPFTILIVEDNATDVELMLHALESADLKPLGGDFEMEVRAKAEGALQLLEERAVDLVLTDMVLPGMDGLDLVSRIQKKNPSGEIWFPLRSLTARSTAISRNRPFSASIITSGKNLSRILCTSVSPTRSLEPGGTGTPSSVWRSRWPNGSEWRVAVGSTRRWERFATWCKVTC